MKSDKNKLYNLTVEEAYKLLKSKDMAKNKCNIQFYKSTPGKPDGGNHNGRKPGSKNRLSLETLNQKFDLSIKSIKLDINKLAQIVQDGFAKQEQFNKKQLEFNQFVLDQFKKHGWVK